ncbi:CHAP domain-containing protein [Modestobacter altitudinis]|uniref:CHAP domain-containing protein n=1 Tax=Modestobacter altitudinis TaxID=2213158 RepID=UPI00110CF149|nr:CHAP domain-containing protein [Modestobacter altitudinis]
MQLARLPERVTPTPTSSVRGPVVRRWAAIVLVLLCAACYHDLPTAGARGRQLGSGPPSRAYPWAGDGGMPLDLWGFVTRQCTSYAAWYLNTHGVPFALLTRGPEGRALFTSAGGWDDAAVAAGFPVLATPAVGSIAQWTPGSPPRLPLPMARRAAPGTRSSRRRARSATSRWSRTCSRTDRWS